MQVQGENKALHEHSEQTHQELSLEGWFDQVDAHIAEGVLLKRILLKHPIQDLTCTYMHSASLPIHPSDQSKGFYYKSK